MSWTYQAIEKIEANFQRSADTHMIKVDMPATPNIHLYMKDESTHPTGSLKHRLARSLFLYGLCNGNIKQVTTIVEASSGSTAVSEAYFARLLGLRFIAVVPKATSQEKIDKIEFYGGECHFVDARDIYQQASSIATELNGYYMDQFTYAERVTDWRGNNNIAESIFQQMSKEPHPVPKWVIVSAGTGGTSATIGRYIRYTQQASRLCVPDPEHSVFYDYYQQHDATITSSHGSRIEGIGRPRVEPSFVSQVVDRMERIPDKASFAAMQQLSNILQRKVGGSTGTNFYCACMLIAEMAEKGESGSVVSMICDSGERYQDTYHNSQWLVQHVGDISEYTEQLATFYQLGKWR